MHRAKRQAINGSPAMILSVHKPYLYAAVGRAASFGMPQEIRQVPRYAVLCPAVATTYARSWPLRREIGYGIPGSVRGGGERGIRTLGTV